MEYPLVKPKYYYSLLQDLVGFVKKPQDTLDSKKSTKLKVYDTIGLFLLKFVFLIPVFLFFAVVYEPENVQNQSMADRFSPLLLLLVGGIILPLIEETGFRLSLKFRPIYLALSSSAMMYYFLTKAIYHTKNSAIDESFPIRIGAALTFGLVIYFMSNIKPIKLLLSKFWDKHFALIFYAISLLFAWIHITKYELSLLNLLLIPILTLPQLISAVIYGYTRTVFGFQYPLLLHISNNLIGIGLSLLPFTD